METKNQNNETIQNDLNIPYKETLLHVLFLKKIDLEKFFQKLERRCKRVDINSTVKKSIDENEKCDKHINYTVYLVGQSSQGVYLTYMKDKNSQSLHIELPWLGSLGDSKLAFAMLEIAKKMCPDCFISLNYDYEKGEFSLLEENLKALIQMRILNMAAFLQFAWDNGGMIAAPGLNRNYLIPERGNCGNEDINSIACNALDKFTELQWDYPDYENAGLANATTPDGMTFTLRFLTNLCNTFVGLCEYVCMQNEKGDVKNIRTDVFIKYARTCPYFHKVDRLQFILEKMPEDDWEELYNEVPGKELKDMSNPENDPNTYIMRWNPAISSVSIESYREILLQSPEGYEGNWSIYDWESAKEGDEYYMLRVGDGPNGIIAHGKFLSDPYEGDDWAGGNQKRHYVNLTIEHPVDPDDHIASANELGNILPEIDWNNGHSGELITKEQARRLKEYFNNKLRIREIYEK